MMMCGVGMVVGEDVRGYEGGADEINLKLDMPDVVRVTEDVSIGFDVSKRWYGTDGGDDWDYFLDKEGGWEGNVKVTVKWVLIDLRKGK